MNENAPTETVKSQLPFSRGVNFPVWFETRSAQAIQFSRYVEQDFLNAKSLGADVIRVPIKMHSMTLGEPDYKLDPLLFQYLDTVVDWAEKHKIYLILDNHSFDPRGATAPDTDKILVPVWVQIAGRYKNRGEYVLYEVLNEPHGIDSERWGIIQGMAIDKIREIDQKHTIIAGGVDFNSIGRMPEIPVYKDNNLIYTFHFYDPHMFTHQGATWGTPSMATLAGVPFPADAARMPQTPEDLKGTWVESALKNYERDAQPEVLKSSLDKAVAFSQKRGVPVFCGEFGVYMIQSPPEDRVKWYEFVTKALNEREIAWTSWDYYGGFGVFKTPSPGNFNTDLNIEVVRALGFTYPLT
ncbi:MAG: glycoside hydrolase family 5 protein [Treponema sp.]|jgi:endoglucanase|nr:glycoside hydrolase family 5 protein [Treponema sp.]